VTQATKLAQQETFKIK